MVECDYGLWEGSSYQQVLVDFPHSETGYNGLSYKAHDGESFAEVIARLLPWVLQQKEDCFAVSHKGVIQALYAHSVQWTMEGPPPQQLDFNKIQLFEVISSTNIQLVEADISLEKK